MRSVCLDCGPLEAPTAATIDQLARLELVVRRCGCKLELSNASSYLVELIEFVGLSEVLCERQVPSGPSGHLPAKRGGVEPGREAEQRKDPGGVEEERELGDPPVR
jgi:hypothetical protein